MKHRSILILVFAAAAGIVSPSARHANAAITISGPTDTFTGVAPGNIALGTTVSGTFYNSAFSSGGGQNSGLNIGTLANLTPAPIATDISTLQVNPTTLPLISLNSTTTTDAQYPGSANGLNIITQTSPTAPLDYPILQVSSEYQHNSLSNTGFDYLLIPGASAGASFSFNAPYNGKNDAATVNLTSQATVTEAYSIANSGPTAADFNLTATQTPFTQTLNPPTGTTTLSNAFYVSLVDTSAGGTVLGDLTLTNPAAVTNYTIAPNSTLTLVTTAVSNASLAGTFGYTGNYQSPSATATNSIEFVGTVAPVPEPASFLLLVLGGAYAIFNPFRRRRAAR